MSLALHTELTDTERQPVLARTTDGWLRGLIKLWQRPHIITDHRPVLLKGSITSAPGRGEGIDTSPSLPGMGGDPGTKVKFLQPHVIFHPNGGHLYPLTPGSPPTPPSPDEREVVQKKTFTKWVNSHLARVSCRISDLYKDLRDGRMLIKLLEVLSGEMLVRRFSGKKRHSLGGSLSPQPSGAVPSSFGKFWFFGI